jgi:hypothetical protein
MQRYAVILLPLTISVARGGADAGADYETMIPDPPAMTAQIDATCAAYRGEPLRRCRAKEHERLVKVAAHEAELQRQREAEMKRQAAEDAADDAEDEAIRNNPKAMAAIFGAEICLAQSQRKAVLDEIAKQKKYARIGGVENRLSLLQLQNTIRRADELIEKERSLIKTEPLYRRVKPSPCSDAAVKLLVFCKIKLRTDVDEKCDGKDLIPMLNFVSSIDDDTDDQ